MADTFPLSEAAELSTCGEDEDNQPGEDMEEEEEEDDEAFTVQLGTTYSCRKADGTYHDAEVVKMRTNKRAKREEYMVRYVGATRRQTEWVDISRLVPIKPQKDEDEDEDAEEGLEQEVSENDQTLEYPKPDEDEPEIKKAKVECNEDAANSSVVSSGDFAEELTCLLCGKLYEDPVMVECGHNFCRACIDEAWGDSFTCPDCKEAITEKTFTTNRALANMIKKTAGALGVMAPVTPVQNEMTLPVKNCPEHEEKVKIYCKDDGTLCCIICQDSLKHAGHSFLPINEAVGVYREKLSGLINPLEEALTKTEELAVQYGENIEQHKPTVIEYRHKVVSDFEKMNNFLKEQKEKLLLQFHEQSQSLLQEMESNATKMEATRDGLREASAEASERVNDTNSVSFLIGLKSFLEKVKEQQKVVLSSKNTVIEKELCQATFNGPLQYIVWKQMKSVIGPIPEGEEQLTPSIKEEPKTVDPPVPKDAVMESEHEESDDDQEEAAQGPEDSEIDLSGDLPPWIYKGRREIWIIGDGYTMSASREIEKGPYGYNLGFPHPYCNVRWLSSIKFWSMLLPKLKKEAATHRRPSVIFIHVGAADLERKASEALNTYIINYLSDISREFRRVDLVLSGMLPRKEWLGTSREDIRKSFNATLAELAGKRRYHVVLNDELEKALTERFKSEGGDSFLNTSECNIFVKSMRDAVLKAMVKDFQNFPENYSEQEKTIPAEGTSAKPTQFSAKQEPNSVKNSDQQSSPMEIVKAPGAANPSEPMNVWLVGNAYISRAQRHAEKQPYGINLGMKESYCNVRWLGRTTRWNNLVPEIKKSLVTLGTPNIVFLHIGTDDLEATSYENLVNEMRNSLGRLVQLFPKVTVILSTVLPTGEWMGNPLEEYRMMFNTRLSNYAEKHGLQLVKFYKLEMKLKTRFKGRDRYSFLSAAENDMFITIIKDCLLMTMMKSDQTDIKK